MGGIACADAARVSMRPGERSGERPGERPGNLPGNRPGAADVRTACAAATYACQSWADQVNSERRGVCARAVRWEVRSSSATHLLCFDGPIRPHEAGCAVVLIWDEHLKVGLDARARDLAHRRERLLGGPR